jgi:ketopantoate reductase
MRSAVVLRAGAFGSIYGAALARSDYDVAPSAVETAVASRTELIDLPGSLQVRSLADEDRANAVARLRKVGETLVEAGSTEIRVSVLQAIESGRRTEVEAIHGDMLWRARRHGIDVPVLETVTRFLRGIDAERDV